MSQLSIEESHVDVETTADDEQPMDWDAEVPQIIAFWRKQEHEFVEKACVEFAKFEEDFRKDCIFMRQESMQAALDESNRYKRRRDETEKVVTGNKKSRGEPQDMAPFTKASWPIRYKMHPLEISMTLTAQRVKRLYNKFGARGCHGVEMERLVCLMGDRRFFLESLVSLVRTSDRDIDCTTLDNDVFEHCNKIARINKELDEFVGNTEPVDPKDVYHRVKKINKFIDTLL